MIEAPGIYTDIPDADYHADPVGPSPSLSSSIAKLVVLKSPRHAWLEHPRLNKAKAYEVEKLDRKKDVGSGTHKLVLGAGRTIKQLGFEDYKSKAAQEARKAAMAAGLLPMLADDYEKADGAAESIRAELIGTALEGVLDDGDPETTLVWRDVGGIWCRARLDFLPRAARAGGFIKVPDVKTNGGADLEKWNRTAFDIGANIQAAFYERGLRALIPGIRGVEFLFAVAEQEEPHGVRVFGIGGEALEKARGYVDVAMAAWATCLAKGVTKDNWPGYAKDTTWLDEPVYYALSMEMRRLIFLDRIRRWQGIGAAKNPDLLLPAS